MTDIFDRITALRERWRIELKECQDSLLDPPKAIPNPLDRMVVEYDYLLVEAQLMLNEHAYKGPHHSTIDATACSDLVLREAERTYRVIDATRDALKEGG